MVSLLDTLYSALLFVSLSLLITWLLLFLSGAWLRKKLRNATRYRPAEMSDPYEAWVNQLDRQRDRRHSERYAGRERRANCPAE